jgi:hypothetical protein
VHGERLGGQHPQAWIERAVGVLKDHLTRRLWRAWPSRRHVAILEAQVPRSGS